MAKNLKLDETFRTFSEDTRSCNCVLIADDHGNNNYAMQS